jgi:hypothetical protein
VRLAWRWSARRHKGKYRTCRWPKNKKQRERKTEMKINKVILRETINHKTSKIGLESLS